MRVNKNFNMKKIVGQEIHSRSYSLPFFVKPRMIFHDIQYKFDNTLNLNNEGKISELSEMRKIAIHEYPHKKQLVHIYPQQPKN